MQSVGGEEGAVSVLTNMTPFIPSLVEIADGFHMAQNKRRGEMRYVCVLLESLVLRFCVEIPQKQRYEGKEYTSRIGHRAAVFFSNLNLLMATRLDGSCSPVLLCVGIGANIA